MMLHSENKKVHYKMYKKGKTWIFAGIVTATLALGVSAPQVARADTTTDEPTSATQNKETTEDTTQVTLKAETTVQEPKTDSEEVTTPSHDETVENSQPEDVAAASDDEVAPSDQSEQPQKPEQQEPANTSKTDENVTAYENNKNETPDQKQVEAPVTPIKDTTEPTKETTVQVEKRVQKLARTVQAPVVAPKTLARDTETIDQWMPNKKLQQAILLHLRRQNPGKTWNSVADITKDDMALLTSLSVYGSSLSGGIDTYNDRKPFSLEGLQYAVNLTQITMGTNFNYATQKYYGDIEDVSPLANLTKLTSVDLQHNRIGDITPLAGLPNVTELYLAFNSIADFSPLAGHNYKNFNASNQVVFLPPVKINAKTRTAHLAFQFKNEKGEIIPLEARGGIAYPDRVVGSGNAIKLFYKLYWSGGTPTPDGNGGLYFTDMKDQIPGMTSYPGYNIDPLEENYYLTGAVTTQFPGGYSVDVGVIQPYVIGDMGGTVTAHYQDKSGKTLSADVVLDDGFVGDDYTTKAAEIEGYTLTKTPDNATGKYAEGPTDVYYIYEAKTDPVDPPVVNPAADVTVTVHYQTADGRTVAPDKIFTGKQGATYTTSPVTVEGYTLVETPANASGTLGDRDITVTYVYAPVETDGDGDQVDPEAPDTDSPDTQKPDTGADEGNDGGTVIKPGTGNGGSGDQIVTDKTPVKNETSGTMNLARNPATNTAQATLPQTNEQHRSAGLWGLVVLLGSLLGLVGIRRKNK